MSELLVQTRDGEFVRVASEDGVSLMEAIRAAGIDDIAAICGGVCSCATCHVHVDAAFVQRLPAMSENERELLSTSGHCLPTSRLACQVVMDRTLNGVLVTIAPDD